MHPDVIVVGGGIMGCMTALRLADEGLQVVVLERSVPGAEASSAAAGILGPLVESLDHEMSLRLGIGSREMHADLAEELLEASGLDVGFRRCGALRVAFADEDEAELREYARALQHKDLRHEVLTPEQTREREPSCNPAMRVAIDLPDEAQVDPRVLLRATALACERKGVVFRTGATVREVKTDRDRVLGVQADDEFQASSNVVVAAGSWTSLVPGVGIDADCVFPVRGQMVATETRPPLFKRVVFGAGGYVVTRPSGRVLCGSTEERVGFRRGVTFEGVARILKSATTVAPALKEAAIADQWSSFRPGTPDGLPLVGPLGPSGLFVASGHYRNGILMAPITARLVTDSVLGRDTGPEAQTLWPKRFSTNDDRRS